MLTVPGDGNVVVHIYDAGRARGKTQSVRGDKRRPAAPHGSLPTTSRYLLLRSRPASVGSIRIHAREK